MFESLHGWIQANPLTSAMAVCYLLTFVAVRQIKPLLPHFPLPLLWLPEEFRKRLILRACVFMCGFLISLSVAGGLYVFKICPISPLQILYAAGLVGFLAPFVYDLLWGIISLLEFCKILPKGISKKIKWLLDPEKLEVVVDKSGDIEKVRQHDQTIWKRKRGG
jgi:hypothetical protein